VSLVARALFRERPRGIVLAGRGALLGTVVQGIGNYNLPIMSNSIYLGLIVVLALTMDPELSWEARRGDAPRADSARPVSRSPVEIVTPRRIVESNAGAFQRSNRADGARTPGSMIHGEPR